MKLEITNEAMDFIKKRLPKAADFLLTADDGSNNYSEGHGGACTVGDSFQIVGVNEVKDPYDVKIDDNQDVPFFTSKNDMTFFENGMKIDLKGNWLQLKSNGGIIDGQMTTNDATGK